MHVTDEQEITTRKQWFDDHKYGDGSRPTSFAVDRVVTTPVRINSPLGIRRNATDDQLVEGLRRTDLR